jgi:hypothetical protein
MSTAALACYKYFNDKKYKKENFLASENIVIFYFLNDENSRDIHEFKFRQQNRGKSNV